MPATTEVPGRPQQPKLNRPLRIALVFDALFPVTKGGAERWFAGLAAELAAAGHQVTYVTAGRGDPPPGLPFEVVEVVSSGPLYTDKGKRRLFQSIRFGVASGLWLFRNRRHLDGAYVHQTPLFSVIAARLALRRTVPWVVEWIEWWSRDYWRTYAPGMVGQLGWAIQRVALAATPTAAVFADVTRRRLSGQRPGMLVAEMPGQLLDVEPLPTREAEPHPLVLVVGRLVPEKHPSSAIAAVVQLARTRRVRARLIGEGPLLDQLRDEAAGTGLDISVLGRVDQTVLEDWYSRAAVLLHPSEREGFGLVVVEAAARGVPVVVVAGDDNAATELVVPGVNGFVSTTRRPVDLAQALERAIDGGELLRTSTRAWFTEATADRSVQATARAIVDLLVTMAQAGRARK